MVKYSVVIPLKNEEGNIGELLRELAPVMEGLKQPWEVLCIDDGSTDGTLEQLHFLQKDQPSLRIVAFQRNYGQSSAFDAGFRLAHGEFVITLDGDRQNDPRDIPRLVQAAEKADLVCGYREKRNDPWHKRITSILANAIRSRFCGDGVRDTGCSLKIYRRDCLQKIKMYHGMHRFLPALFKHEGFTIVELPVNHRERVAGKTKYNFLNRSFNTLSDMWAVRWMGKRQLRYQIRSQEPSLNDGLHD